MTVVEDEECQGDVRRHFPGAAVRGWGGTDVRETPGPLMGHRDRDTWDLAGGHQLGIGCARGRALRGHQDTALTSGLDISYNIKP